jgi:hypothetical protein
MSSEKVTRDDIKSKLAEIQSDATGQVESAKTQVISAVAGVALLLLVLAFLFGRSAGVKKNTVIEITRA